MRAPVVEMIASPHHPYVVAVHSGPRKLTIFDARGGVRLYLGTSSSTAAFMPDGASLVGANGNGGLTTWDLRPLLKDLERTPEGVLPFSDGEELLSTGNSLQGPQVSPGESRAVWTLILPLS